jgi:hypothetical protein
MVGEKNARELGAGSGGRRLMKRLQGRLSLEKPKRVVLVLVLVQRRRFLRQDAGRDQ